MKEPAIPSDLPRDPAPAVRRRPYRVNVRLTREEYGHLREQACTANQQPATLTRGLIMGARLKTVSKKTKRTYGAASTASRLTQAAAYCEQAPQGDRRRCRWSKDGKEG